MGSTGRLVCVIVTLFIIIYVVRNSSCILTTKTHYAYLPAYNMTVGQPGGSVDGVHYRGGVSIAIADALMNMLCNGRCNRTVVID